MEIINPQEVKKIKEARQLIAELQTRLLANEQALDDLVRAVEIAEITKQFQVVNSFRAAGEALLQNRLVVPAIGENENLKIQIIE